MVRMKAAGVCHSDLHVMKCALPSASLLKTPLSDDIKTNCKFDAFPSSRSPA
jgi:hypothetical protein